MDVDTAKPTAGENDKKVVVITNLTRNVAETHLSSIFGFYGEVVKIDLPVFGKCKYFLSVFSFFLLIVKIGSWTE